mmetsp:Transcript_17959/g.22929  ORF Transcript_17959/g.22929 Transcript_17959/m.22929 type:complete len:90 (+) Transcript_17959:1133-1402(+)
MSLSSDVYGRMEPSPPRADFQYALEESSSWYHFCDLVCSSKDSSAWARDEVELRLSRRGWPVANASRKDITQKRPEQRRVIMTSGSGRR